jgi:hypothetical protein
VCPDQWVGIVSRSCCHSGVHRGNNTLAGAKFLLRLLKLFENILWNILEAGELGADKVIWAFG